MLATQPEERRRAEQVVVGAQAIGDELADPSRPRSRRGSRPARRARPRSGGRTAGSAERAAARSPRRGSRRRRAGRRGGCSARRSASAWTRTRPPASPRPLRPASWVISAKVRSSERKSGSRSAPSASRMTLSVTSGKSWPLATIWVPTRTPESAASKRRSTLRVARAGGAVRVEPEDLQRRQQLVQLGLDPLGARADPGDRHRRALRDRPPASARRARSDGSAARRRGGGSARRRSSGHSQAWPQERQVRWVDQPRRLISRIALPPSAATCAEGLARPGMERARHAAAHVDDLDGRQRPPVDPARQLAAARARASSPAAAWPSRRAAPRPPRPPGAAPPRARRSAGRSPACRRSRAPRRSRSGPGRRRREHRRSRPDADPCASPDRSRRHSS